MHHILVVDDDEVVRDIVGRYLVRDGYRVTVQNDGDRVVRALTAGDVSLVVLDVMLPTVDGLEVCRRVRQESDVPIILLTARGEEADRIVGLQLGADDYVTKPFSPRELVARVRTVLRRTAPRTRAGRIVTDRMVVDPGAREVEIDGRSLRLTAKEFDLLRFLAEHPGQVFSRDQLKDRVWGSAGDDATGTVTVHIRRLREKVEDDPARPVLIQTVWGVGYRLAA